MNSAITISILAALLQLPALYIYNKNIISGTAKPNITSWGIWTLLTILGTTTYRQLTGDIIVTILPLTISCAIIITFLCIVYRRNFVYTFDYLNATTLIIGFLAALIWYFFQSATYANLILQIAALIAYLPTRQSVKKNPHNEPLMPWFLWTISYALGGVVVLLRWTGQYEALVYPLLNAITSGNIAYILFR